MSWSHTRWRMYYGQGRNVKIFKSVASLGFWIDGFGPSSLINLVLIWFSSLLAKLIDLDTTIVICICYSLRIDGFGVGRTRRIHGNDITANDNGVHSTVSSWTHKLSVKENFIFTRIVCIGIWICKITFWESRLFDQNIKGNSNYMPINIFP